MDVYTQSDGTCVRSGVLTLLGPPLGPMLGPLLGTRVVSAAPAAAPCVCCQSVQYDQVLEIVYLLL